MIKIIFQENLETFEWLTDFMDCISTNRFYPASNESDVYQKALSDDKDDNFLAGTEVAKYISRAPI